MALSDAQNIFLKAKNHQSKRLRYLLAMLNGENLKVDLRAFVLQANSEEFECWLAIQKECNASAGLDNELQQIAITGLLEYQIETAFEEGRRFAYSQEASEVAEFGMTWRETKNPYLKNDLTSPEVSRAWTEGFQNALEIIVGESW